MTQPQGQPQEITNLPIQVGGAVVQGLDGRPWVALQVSVGTTQYTVAMPEQTATELCTLIPQVLTEVAAQARRAKLGLLLPTQVGGQGSGAQGAGLLPPNGHRHS